MMNRRILSLALACALSLSMLTACGPKDTGSASSTPDASTSQNDASTSITDGSQGDVSEPVASVLTLNKTDVTLNAAGATFALKASVEPASDAEITFESGDPSVITVTADGTITAVAPGTALVVVYCGDQVAECVVRCDWTDAPATGDTSTGDTSTEEPEDTTTPTDSIDLMAFYDQLYAELFPLDENGDPTGPFTENFAQAPDMLEGYYPGLAAVDTKQLYVLMPMMTGVPYEVVMVEVANAADVDTVKGMLQARIDSQINNQHNYPMVIENWELNARIATNGNYILMAVCEVSQSFVDAFNGLF